MAFTANDLVILERAIASGVKRVAYADRTVEYQSIADMRSARSRIALELGIELRADAKPRRSLFRVSQTGNGY